MGRWPEDARGRLVASALELYAERGFEQTTAAEIADRAGVTERTFFRHFADKREVLFQGSEQLHIAVVEAIAATPPATAPVETVSRAFETAGGRLTEREHSVRRAAVIAANAGLQERELLKFATLADAAAAALRERGVTEPAASLAAQTGATVFRIGFETWIADGATGTLPEHIHDAYTQLKALTAGD